MPRPPRHFLKGHLHEATLKGIQARYFFVPGRRLNKLIIGALAYGQKKYDMKICYPVCMTNHQHLLYLPDSPEQARNFFRLVNAQISREVGKEVGWSGGIFKERYNSTIVTDEPEAQIARLKYLMSNGVKEGLVKRPEHWPGVNGAKALLSGSMRLEGKWVDRTKYDEACRKYERQLASWKKFGSRGSVRKPLRRPSERQFEIKVTLELTPIPPWQHLAKRELMEHAKEVHQEILEEYAEVRATVAPDWRRRITDKRRRCFRPKKTKKGKRPKFHAASKEEWICYVKNWNSWLTRYEDASRRLKRGVLAALFEFPEHCFLPTGLVPREVLEKPPP